MSKRKKVLEVPSAAVCMICGKPITKAAPWGFTKIGRNCRWFHEACAKGERKNDTTGKRN